MPLKALFLVFYIKKSVSRGSNTYDMTISDGLPKTWMMVYWKGN